MADAGKMRFLKRFPEDKWEQIKQVMSYIQMCGLTGKDLVSIGGYIDRQKKNELLDSIKEVYNDYIKTKRIQPVGNDSIKNLRNRFKIKSLNNNYRFDEHGWNTWSVTNYRTKACKLINCIEQDWPSHVKWGDRIVYNVLMAIRNGDIQLNF